MCDANTPEISDLHFKTEFSRGLYWSSCSVFSDHGTDDRVEYAKSIVLIG